MRKKEVRFTMRIPDKLYKRILEELSNQEFHQSMNSFILECTSKVLNDRL